MPSKSKKNKKGGGGGESGGGGGGAGAKGQDDKIFKAFSSDGLNMTQLKSSKVRGIVSAIRAQYPMLGDSDEIFFDIFPLDKKVPIYLVKTGNHVEIVVRGDSSTPLFFRQWDGPYLPTLRILHRYPLLLPRLQVDLGAIKFVLKGASIFCAGFTSAGGRLPELDLPAGTAVGVFAEGKQHALAVGVLIKSLDTMRNNPSGAGVVNSHYLGDGLWECPTL